MSWSLGPVVQLGLKMARVQPSRLSDVATRAWEIAPSSTHVAPRAFMLPGQLERVRGWAFSEGHPAPKLMGGYAVVHAPTRALLLEHAYLIDGVLYNGKARVHLHPRTTYLPRMTAEQEFESGSLYCTTAGIQYFGNWLMDDCVAYALAKQSGVPVTVAKRATGHMADYEQRFQMEPLRVGSAYFRQLVVFEDCGQNAHKRARARALSELAQRGTTTASHPGAFIVRGASGARRVLQNESELAERLATRRGFRIVDPAHSSVQSIVDAVAGAQVIVGVEGSGLLHGMLALREGGALLTLQPPNRVCPLLKDITDRDEEHFGAVIGHPAGEDFTVDADEVERTLDLFPRLH